MIIEVPDDVAMALRAQASAEGLSLEAWFAKIAAGGLAGVGMGISKSPTVSKVSTFGDLARSEFFGMWRNRTDIADSVEFARDLRENGWKSST